MGTYVKNPGISINWNAYASHGLKRLAERNITPEMVDTWVATGKALEQGGNKWAFVTPEGVAVADKAGKLITTYSKADFDEQMLAIVQSLFGK